MPVVALIEDDPLVRVPLARGLDEAGYNVVAAADGAEAMALLEDRTIDVAVVDVILPGRIDGIDVVRQARRCNPRLKVILTSGRPLPVELTGIAPFVPKPLRLDDLIARVRRVIAGDAPVDDHDVAARARRVIDEFGELAAFYAGFRADEWRDHGDLERQLAWLRILLAVGRLQGAAP